MLESTQEPANQKPVDSAMLPTRRTRVANGSKLWPRVDGRSLWARRAGELLAEHVSDLGGEENISASERALVRRAVTLIVECERRETGFAKAGEITDGALMTFQTAVNTLRRTLESLGLQRRARDVTPSLAQLLALDRRAAGDPNGQGSAWARFPGHPPSGVGADPETAPAALRAESGARHSAGEGSPPMRQTDSAAIPGAPDAQNAPALVLGPGRGIPGATNG